MKQMIRFSVAALCLSGCHGGGTEEGGTRVTLVQILPGHFNVFMDDLKTNIKPIWDAETKGTGVVFAVPVPHLCRVNFEVSTPTPFSHLAFPHWKGEKTASKMASFDGELMASFWRLVLNLVTCAMALQQRPHQQFAGAPQSHLWKPKDSKK